MKTIKLASLEETERLGESIGRRLQANDCVLLEGDLGAGKTTLTKAIAIGLDIKAMVKSPTFTIIREYEGRLPLYHMDAYRLEHAEDDLGFEEYFNKDGVVVIEWAHYIAPFLPAHFLRLSLKHIAETTREITLEGEGTHYQALIEEVLAEW